MLIEKLDLTNEATVARFNMASFVFIRNGRHSIWIFKYSTEFNIIPARKYTQ